MELAVAGAHMHTQLPIAIVGGGPAGAMAAAVLASAGRAVVLFDEKLAWEKPCGGGVTHKALQQYPFLRYGSGAGRSIEQCELISPSGKRVRFPMQHPVAIFSRLALNGLLLERARKAGVEIRKERATGVRRTGEDWRLVTTEREYRASALILAAGARNAFRAQFLSPIPAADLMVTAGYFIPGGAPLMQIQFLKGVAGYIWVFPRVDHVSAGIAGRMGEMPTARLRRILEQWLTDNGFRWDGAPFYSHILPSFRTQSFDTLEVCGDGWALIGDSAGLVDPITGEGLYYALRSAELCASTLLAGRPEQYRALLAEQILPELKLAARVWPRFYRGEIFGDSVLEQMVSLTARSASFRDLMSDLLAGIQGYGDLRTRLGKILPAVMAEGLTAALRRPGKTDSERSAPPLSAPLDLQ
ncbi:MAG: NAD(P)/FAD-dependent oxidoreductase [Terriglobales bacterium]